MVDPPCIAPCFDTCSAARKSACVNLRSRVGQVSVKNGKLRPSGIPTVRDRVVQAAVLLILEPIFREDFEDCCHGFRPKYVGTRLREWIKATLEGWLGLKIKREKTRVVKLHEPKQSLDFLGFTSRWDRSLQGPPGRYWNLEPSSKAMSKERDP